MDNFSFNLKRLRNEKHMTQADLANQLNVTRQTISSWETGRCEPDIATLKKLSILLKVGIDELMFNDTTNSYPRYQKKYVFVSTICFTIVLVYAIFEIFFFQQFKIDSQNEYLLNAFFYEFGIPQIAFLACGVLSVSFASLWRKLAVTSPWNTLCMIIGISIFLPAFFLSADSILYFFKIGFPKYATSLFVTSKFATNSLLKSLLLNWIPFVSGILIFLGFKR